MKSFEDAKDQRQADVYKQGVLAARLERHESGTRFSYLPEYLVTGGPAVAVSLPLSSEAVVTASGAVPSFFAGLLPEGRRLSLLRRAVKTSIDDELSLLLAVGGDTVGDVQIVPKGRVVAEIAPAVVLDPKAPVDFDEVVEQTGIDPSALAGVQDKLSAGMVSLPVEAAGRRFILKLDPPDFRHVVENEFLMYSYARRLKIPTSAVNVLRDVAGRPGLLVERFDRETDEQGALRRLAVEDTTQVMGLHPAAKYDVPYEQFCRELVALCDAPLPALRNLALQLVSAWLTGNGDLHAKNDSLLRDAGRSDCDLAHLRHSVDCGLRRPIACFASNGKADGYFAQTFLELDGRFGPAAAGSAAPAQAQGLRRRRQPPSHALGEPLLLLERDAVAAAVDNVEFAAGQGFV